MGKDDGRTDQSKATKTYAGSGVSYADMDPFKQAAQRHAARTSKNIERFGFKVLEPSRGESAFLVETNGAFLAHVEEGLGSKNLVADAMYELTNICHYNKVAQCTVAMIVNDMITLGALPISTAMHLAIGKSEWLEDEDVYNSLLKGWADACDLARCVFGPGETPTLKGMIYPETAVIAGSATGFISPKERVMLGSKIQTGDSIIILESSGIHANGLTLAREIADELPNGYLTEISDGRKYGEVLLDPTHIYVGAIEDCLNAEIDIHYTVNITGHGWRKFMRANEPFTYVIDRLPTQLPIFDFIQKQGPVEEVEMYSNYNMGAGFALYVDEADAVKVCNVINSEDYGFQAYRAGYITEGNKRVAIPPKDLVFEGETLAVR